VVHERFFLEDKSVLFCHIQLFNSYFSFKNGQKWVTHVCALSGKMRELKNKYFEVNFSIDEAKKSFFRNGGSMYYIFSFICLKGLKIGCKAIWRRDNKI
jgi:hypothetical protein